MLKYFLLLLLLSGGCFFATASSNNVCVVESKKFSFKTLWSKSVRVFKQDGSRQCEEGGGVSAKKMAKALKSAGVGVFKFSKGQLSTRGLAVCGEPTYSINIFYIAEKHKQKALKQGFRPCDVPNGD